MTDTPRPTRRVVLKKGIVAAASLLTGLTFRRDPQKFAAARAFLALDPEARAAGRKLRAAIDAFYETLPVDNRSWMVALDKSQPPVWVDVSNLFRDHIPVGVSFDEGEAILKGAGLRIWRSRATAGSDAYYSGLPTTGASIDEIMLPSLREKRVTAVLVPRVANDFSAIASVQGYMRKLDWGLLSGTYG